MAGWISQKLTGSALASKEEKQKKKISRVDVESLVQQLVKELVTREDDIKSLEQEVERLAEGKVAIE